MNKIMIIKLSKIISCSSEHLQYPASNLLEYPLKSSWRCAMPNELVASVIIQLAESSNVTGLEIGNYRSCIIVVEASTSSEPDNWLPVVNHQFLTHDEAANNKFKDQVQLFTKRDLNLETINKKFDRVKITCMQPANPRELFGLEFIVFKTEVVVNVGLDVFGCFKLKVQNNHDKDKYNEKYLKFFSQKKDYKNDLKEKITDSGVSKFINKQEKNCKPKKKPILEKLEINSKLQNNKIDDDLPKDKVNLETVATKLFGDIISDFKQKVKDSDECKTLKNGDAISNKRPLSSQNCSYYKVRKTNTCCDICTSNTDQLCLKCNLLPQSQLKIKDSKNVPIKIKNKPKKEFCKLFEDVTFALSGYVNPQRDEIRKKALKMGAKYNANPNTTNNKCTHLVCAFKNTPKSQQLKDHCKVVNHKFIEVCFEKKKRIPWRRFALDEKDHHKPESEEEIEGCDLPIPHSSIYNHETDNSDSN